MPFSAASAASFRIEIVRDGVCTSHRWHGRPPTVTETSQRSRERRARSHWSDPAAGSGAQSGYPAYPSAHDAHPAPVNPSTRARSVGRARAVPRAIRTRASHDASHVSPTHFSVADASTERGVPRAVRPAVRRWIGRFGRLATLAAESGRALALAGDAVARAIVDASATVAPRSLEFSLARALHRARDVVVHAAPFVGGHVPDAHVMATHIPFGPVGAYPDRTRTSRPSTSRDRRRFSRGANSAARASPAARRRGRTRRNSPPSIPHAHVTPSSSRRPVHVCIVEPSASRRARGMPHPHAPDASRVWHASPANPSLQWHRRANRRVARASGLHGPAAAWGITAVRTPREDIRDGAASTRVVIARAPSSAKSGLNEPLTTGGGNTSAEPAPGHESRFRGAPPRVRRERRRGTLVAAELCAGVVRPVARSADVAPSAPRPSRARRARPAVSHSSRHSPTLSVVAEHVDSADAGKHVPPPSEHHSHCSSPPHDPHESRDAQ